MKRLASLVCVMLLFAPCSIARTPRRVHINGSKALRLVSLLASGSDTVKSTVKEQHKNEFTVDELNVMSASTSKYDTKDPYFKLGIYQAWGKIGSATISTPIGEATALFELLTGLGLRTDTAMEGTYIHVETIDCKTDVTADIESPSRFQCELVNTL